MSNGISVVKRDGSVESLNLDKVHAMVELACEDLAGVSSSQVEMNSGIQSVSYTHLTLPTKRIV